MRKFLAFVMFTAGLAPAFAQTPPTSTLPVSGSAVITSPLQLPGLNLTPQSAASVVVPAGTKTVFLDSATGKVSVKDSAGVVTVLEGVAPPPVIGLRETGFETPAVAAGTFEYNPAGSAWTFTAGSGISANGSGFTSGNPAAPEGLQVGIVQMDGSISQAFTQTAGTFAISVKAAQRKGNAFTQTVRVLIDDKEVGTIAPSGTDYTAHTTPAFTLTAGTHTLTFKGLNPNGGDNTCFLDTVGLNPAVLPIPPPAPPVPPVPPVPPSPPQPPLPSGVPSFAKPDFGWRVGSGKVAGFVGPDGDFVNMGSSRGGFDYDPIAREIRMASSPVHNCIVIFKDVPPPGEGSDITKWPVIRPSSVLKFPWPVTDTPNPGPTQFTWSSYANGVHFYKGKWRYAIRSYYTPHGGHPAEFMADDGELTQVKQIQQGWGAGFVKHRDRSDVYVGAVGGDSNDAVSGCSAYKLDGTAVLPGGNGQNAPRDSLCYCPPDTWPLGWTPTTQEVNEDDVYTYCRRPRLAAGPPQSAVEKDLLNALIAKPADTEVRKNYADLVESTGRAEGARLIRRWGAFTQVWPAHQGWGDGLLVPGVGLCYAVNCAKGGQNYDFQWSDKRPPGSNMFVTYGLEHICRIATFPFKADGTVDAKNPHWEDLPYFYLGGLAWGPNGERLLNITGGWADFGQWTTSPVIAGFR